MMAESSGELLALLMAHPDWPVVVLAPSTPSDFDTYYHSYTGAHVARLLFPEDVHRLYGDYFGLSSEQTYWDEDDAEEAVLEYYLSNGGHGADLLDLPGDTWGDTYIPIAHEMVEDMPWNDYIVIDCY